MSWASGSSPTARSGGDLTGEDVLVMRGYEIDTLQYTDGLEEVAPE